MKAYDKRRDGETERRREVENLLSEQVLDAAIEVHRTLGGPGLLESLYEDTLFYELLTGGIRVVNDL